MNIECICMKDNFKRKETIKSKFSTSQIDLLPVNGRSTGGTGTGRMRRRRTR